MTQDLEKFGYKQELKRALTLKDLIIYGLIFMVPIAPWGIYGVVADISNGMVPLAYLIGMVAMIFTALSYSRMAEAFPIAGSVYSYAQRGINPHVGFIAGWAILLDYILVPALLYLVSALWLKELIPAVPLWGWILIFIAINTFINIRGIEFTAKTNLVILIFELIALAAFLIVGVNYLLSTKGVSAFTLKPLYNPEGFNLSMVMTATSVAVLSYLGFDAISTLSEETHNPSKTVGSATVATILIIAFLFMAQTYVAALIWPDYKNFPNIDVAFYYIAERAGGMWLKNLTLWATVIAWGIANALAAQAAISRILYSMSRDELLPKFLSKVHPTYKTPYLSTLLVAVLSLIVSLALDLTSLTSLVNFGALTGFLFLHVSVFYYYFIKQKKRSGSDLLKYVVFPLIGFLVIFYVWISLEKSSKILGFSWLIFGIVYSAIVTKGYKKIPPSLEV